MGKHANIKAKTSVEYRRAFQTKPYDSKFIEYAAVILSLGLIVILTMIIILN